MGELLLLIALIAGLFSAALFLLVSFFLLPWAKRRFGEWALALFPLSTFAGAYFAWAMLWFFIKAVDV
ncbi:MAG: hypothetical protein AAF711_10855 [Planctomycetota bacterium]